MWSDGHFPTSIIHADAVTLSNNIYVIGNDPDADLMIALLYDSVSDTWSVFSRPKVFRFEFAFIEFHRKLYIIGGSGRNGPLKSVEMFDTTSDTWSTLPDLPFLYSHPEACIFNDQIIIYSNYGIEENSKNIRWNEIKNCWEELKENELIRNSQAHLFCEVKDIEAIRIITKANRDPNAIFEKCN